MPPPALTATSFVVLGLIELLGPSTPYDLKRFGQGGLFFIWSVPHTQLYSECARLSASGHLAEEREEGGRRRRVFSLTAPGRAALDEWRAEPTIEVLEYRDEGLIKLYFGADPAALSRAQAELHAQRAAFLQAVHEGQELTSGVRSVFEAGVTLEEEAARLWRRFGDGADADQS